METMFLNACSNDDATKKTPAPLPVAEQPKRFRFRIRLTIPDFNVFTPRAAPRTPFTPAHMF